MASDFLSKIAHKFHCEHCYYSTSNKYDYSKHINTLKHKTTIQNASLAINGNSKKVSIVAAYNCDICNFYSKNKTNYDKHLLSEKHKKKCILVNQGEPNKTRHICSQCNKEYLNYNALWKHKKHCVIVNEPREPAELQNVFTPTNGISEPSVSTTDIFLEVLKESKELQNVLIQQNKDLQNKLLELASKQGSNTINSHNKTNNFNLQFFLNETCKDAMNIADFVNSLQLTTDDFETTGKLGFIDGISRIFIKELKKLDTEKLEL